MREAVRHLDMRVFLHHGFQSVMQDVGGNLETIGVIFDVIGSNDVPEGVSAEAG